ncbi:hypothetical protein Slala03_50440 [Streptomyces lavendulae subsp. lavendulae]|nr:hypothetical protein Slala03_50440 [Streptomyces lavendulae subsp. lavendulae]
MDRDPRRPQAAVQQDLYEEPAEGVADEHRRFRQRRDRLGVMVDDPLPAEPRQDVRLAAAVPGA